MAENKKKTKGKQENVPTKEGALKETGTNDDLYTSGNGNNTFHMVSSSVILKTVILSPFFLKILQQVIPNHTYLKNYISAKQKFYLVTNE